jgi:hypothetical protein
MVINDLPAELSAMQDIATRLHELDPTTRTRVLHWIQERFHGDALSPAAAMLTPSLASVELRVVPPPAKVTDEALSVGTLTDFFESRGPKIAKEPPAQSVTGMLHEFVAEFQDLAREWNADGDAAADEPLAAPLLSVAS